MSLLKRYHIPLFFTLTVMMLLVHNDSISLWDQDEAAYAGFAKNMLLTGDWLIPDFMWSEVHRKPPLHFWNIALCYQLFGVHTFSVRFPAAMSIFLMYVMMCFWGRRMFGKRLSFLAAFVLSTTFFVPLLAKVSVTDATLLLCSTVCAFSISDILRGKKWGAVLTFWIGFASALLTKGPPIIIFCFGFISLLILFHPQRRRLLLLRPWFFLPLSLAPLVIWGYLTTLRDGGGFIRWMIDWYILRRVDGSVFGQTGPPGTHLLFILAFFLPYIVFFPKAIWRGFSGIFRKNNEEALLLGAWFISAWLPYEISPSKLPSYAVVAHVPLAFLIGRLILNHWDGISLTFSKGGRSLHFLIFFTFSLVLCFVVYHFELSSTILLSLVIFALGVLIVGLFSVFFIKENISKRFVCAVIWLAVSFQFFINVILLPQLDSYKSSTREVAQFVDRYAAKGSTVILAHRIGHPPSLPFYLGQSLKSLRLKQGDDFLRMARQYRSDSAYVFILNADQKESLSHLLPESNFKTFSSYFTDRKGINDYFVLMNPVARASDDFKR